MSTRLQRPWAVAAASFAVLLSGHTFAQSEPPEEITVRGAKPLEQYRVELEAAREDLVAAYNEANSSDSNDIVCRNERVTGTRMPQRICRSKAQSEAEASASMSWLRSMTHSAGNFRSATAPGGAQVNSSVGAANAQIGAEVLSAESRAAIEAELEALKKENRQVYRAAVKYLELLDEYNAARGVTTEE